MSKICVFTPAFNRAHLLPRLYQSLKEQTNKDFYWLVVDDGSTDDTSALIKVYQNENFIKIDYFFQQNQGMHGAHNTAYANISSELNVCIDSDDFMPTDAIEKILKKWKTVEQKDHFAGLIGLDAALNGNLIGSKFNNSTTTLEDFYLNGGTGDKKLVYRTDVVQKYPEYPLFEGEKYVGLGYKYLLIDQDYKLITLNEILVVVDYQAGGSSQNMYSQYYKNPKGFAFLRKQGMQLSRSRTKKFKNAIHYVSSSLLADNKKFIAESPKKVMTIAAFPFGFFLYLLILNKNKNKNAQHSSEL